MTGEAAAAAGERGEGAQARSGMATCREAIALARESAILLLTIAIPTFLLAFPDEVKTHVRRMGITKIEGAGATLTFDQMEKTNTALAQVTNALTEAKRGDSPTDSAIVRALTTAKKQLASSSIELSKAVKSLDPARLPDVGAIYLGTIDPTMKAWRSRADQNVMQAYSDAKPGAILTLWTDVNLREARDAPEELPQARILRVLQECRAVRVVGDLLRREVDESERDGRGIRIWANVDALDKPVGDCSPK